MAETVQPDPIDLAPKIATLSSGQLTELPPIHQRLPLGEEPPMTSSEVELGPELASQLISQEERASPGGAKENGNGHGDEAADYLNNGVPHKSASPLTLTNDEASQALDAETVENGAATTATASVSEPAASSTDPGDALSSAQRSVQFAHHDVIIDPAPLAKDKDSRDPLGRMRASGAGLVAKLKELASPSVPSSRPADAGLGVSPVSPAAASPKTPGEPDEGSDIDADAEETADEATPEGTVTREKKKKRRMRMPRPESLSASTTPRMMSAELPFMRRNTMSDLTEQRGGLSEGEGRDNLARERGYKRGSSWGTISGEETDNGGGGGGNESSGRRLGHLRRVTALGGGVSDGDAMTPRRPFFPGERATTYGAQKWRQVKNTLKALRQKKDERFDLHKSTELMAELRAGAPAVLMFASMLQRDEHGNKRIPVLLEQVKVHIRDSQPIHDNESERHWLFTIDLEYGSGPSRMRWTIKRTIREILNLHWKYKLALRNEKFPTTRIDLGARPKQPKFPLSAFPYLRGVRGLDEQDEEDPADARTGDENTAEAVAAIAAVAATAAADAAAAAAAGEVTAGEATAGEATATDGEDRIHHHRRKSTSSRVILGGRRKPSNYTDMNVSRADISQLDPNAARRRYVERQQRMLEKYLQEMIRWLIFRADSNRLCRFLELSALGVRLAAEGSYHGKECYLHIQSSKGLDFRRVLTPGSVIARHSRKWFLVRQSYIVCVESPENMNIYDVYLVDSKFKILPKKAKNGGLIAARSGKSLEEDVENIDFTAAPAAEKHHTLKLVTSERKVKLFSRNQHLVQQFEESIAEMLRQTPWVLKNRFDSYAPVRTGVHAQWLVDGRDYMWNVSRAINMAKDVIYIHDWWLSPELYMRRPACISQKWRLDRLLQRKAKEGVKIFVIIYRNVEAAIPIDSEYTKFSLLNLHPNIFVQRSPNQFKKNQFFFAHHEKICVVDHDVAFVGGIDLCFGRWDCPQHPVADDKPTGFELDESPKDAEHCQLFPGKDYSNPRVQDFFRLSEPYEEMYDRGKVPRMPWHDIAMQVVGQPARDLTRHFVQRWNYVRRGRKPTRPTPFLLPPPDYKKEDLEALGLTGTCEVQIIRSASTWSLGIEETESSIQSAYVKMIEESDHFVYIENQFFITSTETMNNKIVNRVGDALVERIIRAHERDEEWRAVVIIPLMPGFQNEVNEQDGTSVRLILQCQFRSICRGEHSIFGRLRAAGIDPEDYIQFFSLRQWGKLGSSTLATEQLYIHAKCIVVDDRVALIGSANINERSMVGHRDSEIAAIVRDTDMMRVTMAGRPYLVGRFAHTLRMRLMREHLGLDVDEIMEEERLADMARDGGRGGSEADFASEMDRIYEDEDGDDEDGDDEDGEGGLGGIPSEPSSPPPLARVSSINHDVDLRLDAEVFDDPEAPSSSPSRKGKEAVSRQELVRDKCQLDVQGLGPDQWKSAQQAGLDEGRDSVIVNGREVLVHDISPEGKGTIDSPRLSPAKRGLDPVVGDSSLGGNPALPPIPSVDRRTTEQLGLPRANQLPTLPTADDRDIEGPSTTTAATGHSAPNPVMPDIRQAEITKDCMLDPLTPSFYDDVWCRVAENNTRIFRRVFRVMPDSEATNWTEYKEFKAYYERFKESMDGRRSSDEGGVTASEHKADGGDAAVEEKEKALGASSASAAAEPAADPEKAGAGAGATLHPASAETAAWPKKSNSRREKERDNNNNKDRPPKSSGGCSVRSQSQQQHQGNGNNTTAEGAAAAKSVAGSQRRRRRATTRSSRRGFNATDDMLSRAEAEDVLNLTQGSLVQFPYDWLVVEETNGNWLFQVDQVAPLQIYN